MNGSVTDVPQATEAAARRQDWTFPEPAATNHSRKSKIGHPLPFSDHLGALEYGERHGAFVRTAREIDLSAEQGVRVRQCGLDRRRIIDRAVAHSAELLDADAIAQLGLHCAQNGTDAFGSSQW